MFSEVLVSSKLIFVLIFDYVCFVDLCHVSLLVYGPGVKLPFMKLAASKTSWCYTNDTNYTVDYFLHFVTHSSKRP